MVNSILMLAIGLYQQIFQKALVNKELVYVPSWNNNHWCLDNLTCIKLTLDHSWDQASTNKSPEWNVIIWKNKEVDDAW